MAQPAAAARSPAGHEITNAVRIYLAGSSTDSDAEVQYDNGRVAGSGTTTRARITPTRSRRPASRVAQRVLVPEDDPHLNSDGEMGAVSTQDLEIWEQSPRRSSIRDVPGVVDAIQVVGNPKADLQA